MNTPKWMRVAEVSEQGHFPYEAFSPWTIHLQVISPIDLIIWLETFHVQTSN